MHAARTPPRMAGASAVPARSTFGAACAAGGPAAAAAGTAPWPGGGLAFLALRDASAPPQYTSCALGFVRSSAPRLPLWSRCVSPTCPAWSTSTPTPSASWTRSAPPPLPRARACSLWTYHTQPASITRLAVRSDRWTDPMVAGAPPLLLACPVFGLVWPGLTAGLGVLVLGRRPSWRSLSVCQPPCEGCYRITVTTATFTQRAWQS